MRLAAAGIAAAALAGQQKEEAVFGVSAKTRQSIEQGIAWILSAQNRDGSWGMDKGAPGDPSCTSLAALALMSSVGGPARDAVRAVQRGLDWILDRARRRNGEIGSAEEMIPRMLGRRVHTFFAAAFLSQAYGMRGLWLGEREPDGVKEALEKMTIAIAGSQEEDGTWDKETYGSLKGTSIAWLALRSCHSAGLSVRHAEMARTQRFVQTQFNNDTGLFDGGGRVKCPQAIYASASCLRVLYGLGLGSGEQATLGTAALLKLLTAAATPHSFPGEDGEDYLAAALVTQALIHGEGEVWRAWYTWLAETLRAKQNRDGSWTAVGCISGRTFPTACALISLEAPYKVLPLQEL